jgi:putative ABC transport system permease protein
VTDDQIRQLEAAVAEEAEHAGLTPKNPVSLRSAAQVVMQNGHVFRGSRGAAFSSKSAALLLFMTVEEYNRIEGGQLELSEGEALLYAMKGEIPGDALDFGGFSLNIRSRLDSMEKFEAIYYKGIATKTYVVITAGEEDILRARQALNGNEENRTHLDYEYHFDTQADRDTQISLVSAINSKLKNMSLEGYASGREEARQSFLSVYGVLLFLGLFLGALFILGTVLIIYYKQISEGFDDKERFAIMLKVGLSHDEIKKAIRFQVLSVFFLPLAMTVCHICAAFPVISKLLALFNMTNVALYALCTALTILAFALCYALIYALTAKTYYRIVR